MPDLGALSREEVDALVTRLWRELEEAKRRIEKLERLLEEERRKNRRQAAPFSKGAPKQEPKPPGRRSGAAYGTQTARSTPHQIDERVIVDCPLICPDCGDAVRLVGKGVQYQIDLPRVRATTTAFDVHHGQCGGCGRRVQGRDRRQVSDALGVGNVHFGPSVIAWAASLNKEHGLSYGKIVRLFSEMFGLELERSSLTRALDRLARKAEPTYEQLKKQLRQSPEIYPDETGWKVSGVNHWLHAATTFDTTAYLIGRGRGYEESAELIGKDYAGAIGVDGWRPYRAFAAAAIQTCTTHLVRRCNELIETQPKGACRFPRAVKRILQAGLALRDRRDSKQISNHGLAITRGKLEARMDRLLAGTAMTDPANIRFAKHLRRSRDELFFYLYYRYIEATNWPAEQAIRPAVVNRKTSGGSRTLRGARTQSILMSVLRTAHLRRISPTRKLVQILTDPSPVPRLPLT